MFIKDRDFADPPPPYYREYEEERDELSDLKTQNQSDPASYVSSGRGLKSKASLSRDGRISVTMHLNKPLPDLPIGYANPVREFAVDPSLAAPVHGPRKGGRVPRLSIVIMIVGSRGDVQPFLALGLELHRHGHRVRIATHGTFRQFVKDTGLEFYDIGGDPHDLMSYMVKNPGLMPGWASLTNGDIRKKQKMLGQILEGCWNACFQPDTDQVPFIADAVISNPPAFAHVHCAEALGIPLQLSFTMPWSPTVAFPHPLVNISQSNAEPGLTNFLTYGLAEMMTWQGLGRVINDFRTSKLGLQGLTVRSGPGVVDRLKIPWTYCFSPEIVPKPDDWQNHIDVVGFYFLNLASGYKPPPDLAAFLAAGPPPIYIGFGSVVVEDPDEMTRVIFQATQNAGVRALISVGWGGLGNASNSNIIIPPHVFLLGNVPHDWLFQHVFAVCHHGGAGTTAIGLQLGKPTIVVPFFGDQPFWGAMIHKAGAGPAPIRKDKLDVERLSAAIEVCKTREAAMAAARLGEQIRAQNGVVNGVESFYNHLPVLNMRCDLLPDQLAVWWNARHCLKLSALAAEILCKEGLLNVHELELHRHKEYDTRVQPTDPITGGVVEALLTITTFSDAVTQIFTEPVKGIINTTTAIPRSIMNILDSFTDGLSNTPMLWGSPVRAPGRMNNFTSGMKEGGKALMWGLSDGFTGLVTEPIDGFKEKRWKGLVQGTFRSYINLVLRPAAGALSLVTYPIRGAIRGLTRQNISVERHLRELRIHQGRVAAAEYLGEPVFEGPGPSKQEYYTTPHFDPDEETVRGDDRSPSPQRLRRVRRPEGVQVEHPKKLKRAHDHGKQIERRPTQGPPLPPRAQPQREARREQKIYYEDSPRKVEIIQLFQVACQKKNLKKRKKVMQKRIQWVIMKGGAGTVTQVTAKESSYYGNEHIHVAPPSIGQPPKRSAEIWTEEDEELFSRQIEQAKKASLAPEIIPGGQGYPLVLSTSTSVPPEAYGTHQHEHDDFYAARVYENQLLHAASAWIDREDSPPHQAAHINDDPNSFRREDERWHR